MFIVAQIIAGLIACFFFGTLSCCNINLVEQLHQKDRSILIEGVQFNYDSLVGKLIVRQSSISRRIDSLHSKIQQGRDISIGYFGGSITAGASASSSEFRYTSLVTNRLTRELNVKFTEINAGLGGTGSVVGLNRVQDDLLSKNPDIIILELSVNDGIEWPNVECAHDSLVQKILSYDSTVFALYFCLMDRKGWNVQDMHQKCALKYDIPMISIRDILYPMILDSMLAANSIFADEIHPNDNGHELYSYFLFNYLLDLINSKKL